jgi:hypothetical protein
MISLQTTAAGIELCSSKPQWRISGRCVVCTQPNTAGYFIPYVWHSIWRLVGSEHGDGWADQGNCFDLTSSIMIKMRGTNSSLNAWGDWNSCPPQVNTSSKLIVCIHHTIIWMCLWWANGKCASMIYVIGQGGAGTNGRVLEECFHGIFQAAGDRKVCRCRPIGTQC